MTKEKTYTVIIKTNQKTKVFNTFKDKSNAEHWRDVISLYSPSKKVWVEEGEARQESV
jgi:hypothetical protein